MRESDHLGCISRLQVAPELARGLVAALPYPVVGSERPIGLTLRPDWLPTRAQAEFLTELHPSSAA